MTHRLLVGIPLAGAIALCASSAAAGQAARIGRLPLLEPLTARAHCKVAPVPSGAAGVTRILTVNDSAERYITIGLTAKNKPRHFSSMMSTSESRRTEVESVRALIDADGSIMNGTRSAYTGGTPSRRDEDRRAGFSAADTTAVTSLIRAVRALCRA